LTTSHAIIGYVMCFVLLTIWISGNVSSSLNWPYSSYFRRYHRIMGVFVFLLGIGNCYLGIQDICRLSMSEKGLQWISILVPFCVIVCTIIFFNRSKRQKILIPEEATESLDLSKDGPLVPMYSWKDFGGRIDSGHNWILINGVIYDVTQLMKKHPGGRAIVLSMIGLDASRYFGSDKYPIDGVYCHSRLARYMLLKLAVGKIVAVEKELSRAALTYEGISQSNTYQRRTMDESFSTPPGSRHTSNNRKSKHTSNSGPKAGSRTGSETSPLDAEPMQDYKPTPNRFKDYPCIFRATVTKPNAKNKVMHLKFPLPGRYKNPAGSHVLFQYMSSDGEIVTRAYTPIHYLNKGEIDFFVKIYEGGAMSKHVETMKSVQISFPIIGKDSEIYCYEKADRCWTNLGIIVGGSGLTFAMSMIEFHLHHARSRPQGLASMKISLVNLCHSVSDLFGVEMLSELEASSEGCFKVTHVVTITPSAEDAVNYKGLVGHVTGEILKERMPSPQASSDTAIFVCGPTKMMKKMVKLLENERYPSSLIHMQ